MKNISLFGLKFLLFFSIAFYSVLFLHKRSLANDFRFLPKTALNSVSWSQVPTFQIRTDVEARDYYENEKMILQLQSEIDKKFQNDPDALPKSAFETTQDFELRKSRFQKKVHDEEQLKLTSLLLKKESYECSFLRTGSTALSTDLKVENYNADKSIWKISFIDPMNNETVSIDIFINPLQAEQLWLTKDKWNFFVLKKMGNDNSDFFEWTIPEVGAKPGFSLLLRRTDESKDISRIANNNNNAEEINENLYEKVEIDAEFPGGNAAWNRYITREIERNIDTLQAEGKSGTVVISFIVDTQGEISDVQALSCCDVEFRNCLSSNSILSKIAISIIKKGPKWKPAVQNGRNVKSRRRQPFSFLLAEADN